MIVKEMMKIAENITNEKINKTIEIVLEWMDNDNSDDREDSLRWLNEIENILFREIPIMEIICIHWDHLSWSALMHGSICDLDEHKSKEHNTKALIKAITQILNWAKVEQKEEPDKFNINEIIQIN